MRLIAIVALLLAGLVLPGASHAFRETTRQAEWTLQEVSRDGRTLVVAYTGGGCLHEGKPSVAETNTEIRVRVDRRVSEPEEGEACTMELRYFTAKVRLAAPVAGRAVRGQAPESRAEGLAFGPVRFRGDVVEFLVPRVVGLAPRDAARLLRLAGFKARKTGARGCGARSQVVSQSPRGGSVKRSRAITLAVRPACSIFRR